MKKIKVLIIDDSAFIRDLFSKLLAGDETIEVLGAARDVPDAREKIKKLNPDVITLDIEMPGMNGIEFLQKIMSLRPMPVVMVSSLTQKGAQATLDALEIGAVDYVPKDTSSSFDVDALGAVLIEKVKAAARARVASPARPVMEEKKPAIQSSGEYRRKLVAIGSSTGGVEALRDVLTLLPADCPPVVITQHMPPAFTATFAARLDKLCHIEVQEASHGLKLRPGLAVIAPGDAHLKIEGGKGNCRCVLDKFMPLVSGHKPSVDVLFESVAETGENAVGVILTGMGKDGARGLLAMKKAGAITLGQDEQTCVVYGMPKAAWMAGAVDKQVALPAMAKAIITACEA